MSARAEAMRELARRIREVLYRSSPTHSEKHRAINDLAALEVHALTADEEAASSTDDHQETDAVATVLANAVMRRFDVKLGRPSNDISMMVFVAAKEVMQTFLGPENNVLRALDEIDELEASMQERAT